ncbi:Trigger factor [Usitatibacter rugosus]|uniref:Trigger factor n=1 Tax=Usitatibacter rugosus TaxID=2732067 RepID=A0A6M4GXE4_9PROT|nr:trigger factor [Usitatibacter rugosus]QJR11672.1 Trigger factor [Usitatibacter rugosus]
MQQAVQNTSSPLERNLTVSVPIADLEKEIATRLKKLAQTVRMEGFRPGKVPLKMVERHYGYQIRQEVLNDSVQQSFIDAVKSQNYRVAGYPRFQPVQAGQAGAQPTSVDFTATFEVYPEVNMGDLAGTELYRPALAVGDENVNKTLETLRKQRATFENVARAAQTGDLVNLDFRGTIAGNAFEGNEAKNFAVVLGENRMLPDFESNTVGMKAGETKTFTLKFPDDYADPVKGQQAEFTVTVNSVSEPKLPAVDADFARQLGVEDGDVERLKREVRDNVQKEVDKRVKARVKEQVMDALAAAAAFDLPRSLIDQEVQQMQQSAIEELKSRGMTTNQMTLPADLFTERATRRVKLGLLLQDLVRRHDLTPRPEQVRSMVESHAESYEHPEQLVRWYYAEDSRLEDVRALVVEDNVVEWALGKMKVSDQPVAFDELMGTKA